jgi:hypothetical protein
MQQEQEQEQEQGQGQGQEQGQEQHRRRQQQSPSPVNVSINSCLVGGSHVYLQRSNIKSGYKIRRQATYCAVHTLQRECRISSL